MTSLRAVVSDDVRVIMCVAFALDAPVAEVDQLKNCLLECEHVLHAVELAGTFDFMVEARLPSLADYNERLGALKTAVGHLIARYEANFICRRFVRHPKPEQSIWVPCHHGKVRIAHKLIDKVAAEGDYMRVHCGGITHLVHMTMHAMAETLGESFMLVHRSMLVRCDFVERLLHQDFKWILRLKDGSHETVAKSHVADVMSRLGIASAKIQSSSSNDELLVEQPLSGPPKSTSAAEAREVVMTLPTS